MSKESIKMTPGDDTHLTLLMAPVSLNLVTGQDREHLLAYGRAAFEAGQKCQGCDVPKDGVYQISEPMPADKRALMLSVTASEPFKSQLKECAARIAELEAQLTAVQQGVQPEGECSATYGMNIAQRILHVGGRENAQTYIEFGSVEAVRMLVAQVLRDLPNGYPDFCSPTTHPTQQVLDAPKYRLLTTADTIEPTDEFLQDDATWMPDANGLWNGAAWVPELRRARRAIAAQAKQGGA